MSYIRTSIEGHVLHIHLNRPEARNAFNRAMAEQMNQIMDDYEADVSLRAAVITAEGKTFSAGQDLKAAAQGEIAATKARGAFGMMGKPPVKPLIAAVEGQALAGGMEMTLCCDMVVASTEATFGLAEPKRGLVAIGGGCFRLPRRIPYNIAMEMIITGEAQTASEMHRFGYVNRLVPLGKAEQVAKALAIQIAGNAPLAVMAAKEIAFRSVCEVWSDETAWKRQRECTQKALSSKDRKEGIQAFIEKREPVWTGE